MPKSRTRTRIKKNRRRPGGQGDPTVVITYVPFGQDHVDTECCGRLHVSDFTFLNDVDLDIDPDDFGPDYR